MRQMHRGDGRGHVGGPRVMQHAEAGPGKRTLTEALGPEPCARTVQLKPAGTPVPGQASSGGDAARGPADVHATAAQAVGGAGHPLPFLDRIQRMFGRHDVRGVTAHTGAEAAAGATAIGAEAFAMGNQVAFARAPDLRTAAHEAAHVIQQRGGVQVANGIGAAGDEHERHADAVADLVERGESAEAMLGRYAAGNGGGGTTAVQRVVAQNLAPGTKVTITATQAPGVLGAEQVGVGYQVEHDGGTTPFTYNQLDLRTGGAWAVTNVSTFLTANDVPNAWLPPAFPYNDFGHNTRRLIVQSPVARGDMHDIRAALMMDPQLKVLLTYHVSANVPLNQAYIQDLTTISSYYDGIPNYAQRVAVVGGLADGIRARFQGCVAANSTRMLERQQAQRGQPGFEAQLADATAGPQNADDEFDCRRELISRGFNSTARYVLVNFRDSGHNPGPRPPSHPEQDTGSVGFWDLVQCVIAAGYVPVPMGQAPGAAQWPGPSLVNYFQWPACQANQRRNKRQAEYYLLGALARFNPNVRALAWRSGVTDAISFVGIPVLALDVAGSGGHQRANRREQLLPGRYRQVDLSDRVAAEHGVSLNGVAGWLGALTQNDKDTVLAALGNGPRANMFMHLGHTPAPSVGFPPPPPPEMVADVVRRFVANLQQLAAHCPPLVLAQALQHLPPNDRYELVRALPYAEIVAAWDSVCRLRAHVAQPHGAAPAQAPATTTDPMAQVNQVGPVIRQSMNQALPTAFRPILTVLDQLDQLFRMLVAAIQHQL